MGETYTQLADNSTGNKIRENNRTIGANSVNNQSVFQTAAQTYAVIAEDTMFANAKQHLSLYNGVGSNKILRINKLFITNMLMNVVVAGGARRLDVKKATNFSGGNNLTALKADTYSDNIPVEILIKTGAAVTEGSLLFPLVFPDDEMLLTQNSMAQQIYSSINWIPEGMEIQELTLREGEGMTIRQITNSTVGIVTWIIIFTLE